MTYATDSMIARREGRPEPPRPDHARSPVSGLLAGVIVGLTFGQLCRRVEARQEKASPTTPAATGAEAAPVGYLIPKGQRWDALWKLGRSRRQLGASPQTIENLIRAENFERCEPPLDEAELRRLIREVIERPDRAR